MAIKELLKEGGKIAKEYADKAIKEATPVLEKYAKEAAKDFAEKAVPKAKELASEAAKYTKETAIPKAKEFAKEKAIPAAKKAIADTKVFTEEKAVPAIKKATADVKEFSEKTAKTVSEKTTQLVDLNGDGKIDQEDMLLLLNDIYTQSNNGIRNVSKPVKTICDEYLDRYKDPRQAAEKLITSDIVKCTTSGFLTGFGGVITLPVTIPANVASVLYVQMRMISSVAYLSGLDINSDATQTLVYACLAGVSVANVIKDTGIKLGTKIATSLVEKIPGKTLTAINKKVGFRMLTKFGEKGIINIGKMVPVVGAIVGGGFDLVETKIVANRSLKEFFDGDYEIKEDIEKEIIDIEVEDIISDEGVENPQQ